MDLAENQLKIDVADEMRPRQTEVDEDGKKEEKIVEGVRNARICMEARGSPVD